MVEVIEPSDIDRAAVEIAVISTLLKDLSPDAPLVRWLEYRAYRELVELLRTKGELPDGYVPLAHDARSLREWLATGKGLKRRFAQEAIHLFAQVQAAGGGVIDNICRIYCELKHKGALAMQAATLALTVKGIAAAIVAAGGGFLFIGGLPLTAVIAFLLHAGVLDKACKCAEGLAPVQA